MNILKLIAQLSLDGTRFKGGLREAESAAKRFDRQAGAAIRNTLVGAFGTAAIVAATKKLIEYGDTVHKAAIRTQQSTQALQEEMHWAQLSDASVTDLTRAYKQLAMARDDALMGDSQEGKERMMAFEALGVSRAQLQAQTLSQTFRQIANTIRTVDFGAGELPLLERIFGKAAQTFLPAFQTSLEEAASEAQRLGIVLEDGMVRQLAHANDEITRFVSRLRGPLAAALGFIAKQSRNIVDFLDITVGGMGAYLGAYYEKTKELADGNWLKMLIQNPLPFSNPLERFLGKHTDSDIAHEAAAKAREEHRNDVLQKRIDMEKKMAEVNKAPNREKREGPFGALFSPLLDVDIVKKALKEAEQLASKIGGQSAMRLGVSQLTASGQLGGGRNIVGLGESPELKEAKRQVELLKKNVTAVEEINNKFKSGEVVRFAK